MSRAVLAGGAEPTSRELCLTTRVEEGFRADELRMAMLRRLRSSDHGAFGDVVEFEIEGDGPLGIIFRKSGESIAIRSVVRKTVAAEVLGLLDGMLLLTVEGQDAAKLGYEAAMDLLCVRAPLIARTFARAPPAR